MWTAIEAPALIRLEALSRRRERRRRGHRIAVATYVSLLIHLAGAVVLIRLVSSPPSYRPGPGGPIPVFLASIDEVPSARPAASAASHPATAQGGHATPRAVVVSPSKPVTTVPDTELRPGPLDTADDFFDGADVAASDGADAADSGTPLVTAAVPVDAAEPHAVPSLSDALAAASPLDTSDGTPWGLGLGRVALELDGPQARTTTHEHETITGRLVGGDPDRLVLVSGETQTDVPLEGRAFEIPVTLHPGLNVMRLVAFDTMGGTAEEDVAFDYTPPPATITITTPGDSHVIVAPGGTAVIDGVVEGDDVSTVSIRAGSDEVSVPVEDGRFHRTVTLDGPVTRVWAETRVDGAPAVRSAPVTIVTGTEPLVAVGIDWPDSAASGEAELRATWRRRADSLDGATHAVALTVARPSITGLPELWYVERPRPGVYTFELAYHGPFTGTAVPSVVYVSGDGDLKTRRASPARVDGGAGTVVAKLLLPQGLLWDGDWAAGESESPDRVTRFRFSDGVVWTEAKDRR